MLTVFTLAAEVFHRRSFFLAFFRSLFLKLLSHTWLQSAPVTYLTMCWSVASRAFVLVRGAPRPKMLPSHNCLPSYLEPEPVHHNLFTFPIFTGRPCVAHKMAGAFHGTSDRLVAVASRAAEVFKWVAGVLNRADSSC